MNTANLYQEYKKITQKAADFNNAAAVLGWDQEVYMPSKGFLYRGRQLATLAAQAHELLTTDKYGEMLQELVSRNDLGHNEQCNIALSLEDYEKSRKLTADFVEQLTQQTSNSYNAWIEARRKNDFTIYAPQLEKMIALKKQQAELYGYADHPYDALLDDYEKGSGVNMLDPVFQLVKDKLSFLLQKIRNADQVDDSFFYRHYGKEKQFDFSLEVLKQMGYDLDAGRQDYAEHPFSTSFSPVDVRITTRVDENNFASLLWSSIHEGGHALYEQGLPEQEYGMPLGTAVSLSVHESQSRIWENCAGRSLPFWKFFFPLLQECFPDQLRDVSVQEFYKGLNKVQPSLIRTEADEITYHFHVMIRYEIEKALLGNEVSIRELSAMWNEYYDKYLDIKVPDDRQGILQDVHWSHGSFGYFPTYSLGSFYAAQFFEQAEKDIAGLTEKVENGTLSVLLHWLRSKVHQHGRRYRSEDLCRQITGRGLDFSSFMRYSEKKYGAIYALQVGSDDGSRDKH